MPKEKSLLLTQIFICAAVIAGICVGPLPNSTVGSAQTRAKSTAAKRYACPMHPEVTSTKPRKCPKCGMTLRLVETKADEAAAGSTTPVKAATNDPNDAPKMASDDSPFASSRIPDTPVFDQNGKRLSFYSDLVKGKTVAINFIFTTCTTICPPLTATFRKVQQDLATTAPEATLISISVDPTTDNPHRLNDFAAKFNAGPGWTFVTGDQTEITALLRALGAAVGDKNDHTPMILIGNDATGYWTRAYGLSSPTSLVKSIVEAANHK
jgi:cytochrome oxidase Cu insertion factor (SCO1/SenC/PrrC family)